MKTKSNDTEGQRATTLWIVVAAISVVVLPLAAWAAFPCYGHYEELSCDVNGGAGGAAGPSNPGFLCQNPPGSGNPCALPAGASCTRATFNADDSDHPGSCGRRCW